MNLCLVTKCNFSILYVLFNFSLLFQNIKKFHVIFINDNCFRLFYMLIIYFEKFSAWVCCLPFEVNVTLNLSILTLMLWNTGKMSYPLLSSKCLVILVSAFLKYKENIASMYIFPVLFCCFHTISLWLVFLCYFYCWPFTAARGFWEKRLSFNSYTKNKPECRNKTSLSLLPFSWGFKFVLCAWHGQCWGYFARLYSKMTVYTTPPPPPPTKK